MSKDQYLPDRIRESYLRKYLLVVLVVFLVVAGIGVYTQDAVSRQITDQRQRDLLTTTELDASMLDQWLSKQMSSARTVSQHQALATGNESSVRSSLQTELNRSASAVAGLHYVNYETRTIEVSTSASAEGKDVAALNVVWPNRQSFGNLSFDDSDTVVQSWVYSDSGNPSLAYLSPIPNTTHALVRVVRTNQHAERFKSSINDTRTVVVGRQTGRVLFARKKSTVLTQYSGSGSSTILDAASERTSDTLLTGDSVVAFTPVPGESSMMVVKSAPKSEALAVRQRVQQNLLLLIGAALLGLFALVVLVGRGPLRSMRNLASQATAISNGDLADEIADENRIDEVGQLRTAFRDTKAYLDVVSDQADALARQSFDDDILDEPVPGHLGESLDRMRADLEQSIADMEQAREEAEQSREEAQGLAESLEQQAEAFSDVMTRAANGDLTQRLDTDTDNEAMRAIARQSNDMLAGLEHTVRRIDDLAERVDVASETAVASAQEIRTASEQVSRSVQEIADGAESQNRNLEQVSDEMTALSATVEEVAASADEVAETSKRAAKAGEDGRRHASEAATEMDAIQQKANETIDEVESLQTDMKRISEVVDLIDDIADQTNMLALNASIEAAHADDSGGAADAGDGFDVVADEIKALAEDTQRATDDIEEMLTEIQNSTARAVEDMREMGERVDSGQETVVRATEALEEIGERVTDANDEIQPISEATDDQAASTEDVMTTTDEVQSISEETAAKAENAAAAAEEQTASVTEVTQNIDSLSESASELSDLVDEFETGADNS